MAFEKVASLAGLKPGELKQVNVGGKEICLANVGGDVLAIDNKCTHVGGDLSLGDLDGDVVECPFHGSQFNVRTGEVVQGPARRPVTSYAAKVEGDDILVDAG